MKRLILLLVLLGTLVSAVAADEIYLANRPFKGRVAGVGSEVRVSLADLANAMNLRLEQSATGWLLGGRPVPTSLSEGVVWVRVDQLPADLVRVVTNTQFKTIDLYRAAGEGSDVGVWGAEGVLVVFGTSWCPATKAMQPTLEALSQSRVIRLVQVDIEAQKSPNFREWAGYFEGDKVPFYVLFNSSGRKLHSFYGFTTYQEMVAILEKYLGAITDH